MITGIIQCRQQQHCKWLSIANGCQCSTVKLFNIFHADPTVNDANIADPTVVTDSRLFVFENIQAKNYITLPQMQQFGQWTHMPQGNQRLLTVLHLEYHEKIYER